MSRKIEWNPEHKDANEQQDAFVDEFLSWSPTKKWKYLMKLASQGIKHKRKAKSDGLRKIEWK